MAERSQKTFSLDVEKVPLKCDVCKVRLVG